MGAVRRLTPLPPKTRLVMLVFMDHTNKKSKVVKWALILGIVIVLNLFFNYTLSLVYNAPEYEKFCPTQQVRPAINDQKQCLAVGGQWTTNYEYTDQNTSVAQPAPAVKSPTVGQSAVLKGYCNPDFTCQKTYEDDLKIYEKNVFITLIILGLLAIIAGVLIKGIDVLSLSLSLGGVLSFIIASMRFWSLAGNVLKVGILGVALAALVVLAIKKFQD